MKKLTLVDIATILQLDESFKKDLKENFDNCSEQYKDDIIKILWDGLYELKDELARIKYNELLLEVDKGKRELKTDLYREANRKVWQYFEDILSGKKKDVEKIEEIRKQIKSNIDTAVSSS